MELIRRLPTRRNKNRNLESWAVFWCDFCQQEVERRVYNGKRNKSCGCFRIQLMSESLKYREYTDDRNRKIAKALKGKKHSKETKQKIRETLIKNGTSIGKNNPMYGVHRFGKESPNWQDGKSFEPYGIEFNKDLKQQILERDNYICQDPNCTINEEMDLHIHHIDYNKNNNLKGNFITLCNSCHSKTNGKNKRKYYTEFYQNIIKGKINNALI